MENTRKILKMNFEIMHDLDHVSRYLSIYVCIPLDHFFKKPNLGPTRFFKISHSILFVIIKVAKHSKCLLILMVSYHLGNLGEKNKVDSNSECGSLWTQLGIKLFQLSPTNIVIKFSIVIYLFIVTGNPLRYQSQLWKQSVKAFGPKPE